jgi:hypothetical protein
LLGSVRQLSTIKVADRPRPTAAGIRTTVSLRLSRFTRAWAYSGKSVAADAKRVACQHGPGCVAGGFPYVRLCEARPGARPPLRLASVGLPAILPRRARSRRYFDEALTLANLIVSDVELAHADTWRKALFRGQRRPFVETLRSFVRPYLDCNRNLCPSGMGAIIAYREERS